MNKYSKFIIPALGLLMLAGAYLLLKKSTSVRDSSVVEWINHPLEHPDWLTRAGSRCKNAPFIIPSEGYIGYLWNDTFKLFHPHQGIDIFGGRDVGVTPVYVVYDGYLTRNADWKSSLIIRIPHDPLQPGRQIWTYYTHLADPNGQSLISDRFPPGVKEMAVKQGDLLGYQGNYSGDPNNPVGIHLHFSVVKDNGRGNYLNELDIQNTVDPSPYFGMDLNADTNRSLTPAVCRP